jgi:hypothetical protein
MKPLNLDNSPCSPISSNCVIWQGPDIPCIKLCKGDTVSDVVYKLGMELCNIMELLDVNGYDLSCFDLASCKPQNIQELIQFLIERICALEDVDAAAAATPTTSVNQARSASADTLVTVAPCFVIGTTTVMPVSEYAITIGTRICGIIDQITIINNQITNLDIRVTTLETAPAPVFTVPSISVDCTLSTIIVSPGTYTLTEVLDALVNDNTYGYCALTSTTGLASDILAAVQSQCIVDTDTSLVYGTPFSVAYLGQWVPIASTDTVADAINNIWIALCDVYQYVSSLTFTGSTTSTIALSVSTGPAYTISAKVIDTGWVDLDGFGFYTGADTDALRPRVRRIGNVLHFKGQVMIPIDDGGGAPLLWQYQNVPPVDTYYLSTTVTPASVGPGSVIASASGLITFNQGNSVIPTSVMGVAELLDDGYTKNFTIGTRRIQIDNTPDTSSLLTTLGNLTITSSKTLAFALLKNGEQNIFSGTAAFDTSHLNYIVSHVRSGEFVPKFDNANTNVNSNALAGTIPLNMEYDANLTYPFSCNANDESNLGGFIFQLDGLIAYIDPCTTDIPTPIVCP